MQLGMFVLVVRAIVEASFQSQLDVVDEFDVRTLVNISRIAGGVVGNKDPDGSALLPAQRAASKAVTK